MPKASKSRASETVDVDGYQGHFEDFGQYTVGFETYTADADLAPLFAGLPDDRCQCPHMGYVLEGSVKFTSPTATRRPTRLAMRTTHHPVTPRRCTPARRSSSSARRPSSRRQWRSSRSTWRPLARDELVRQSSSGRVASEVVLLDCRSDEGE